MNRLSQAGLRSDFLPQAYIEKAKERIQEEVDPDETVLAAASGGLILLLLLN